ncbi:MAG: decaprenyl-phosphate phosphoribosyltransferase [Ignavibacteriales bacterium CG_4_9_14_3_um_filter_34_10]|nr:MAG: decaprenyl-phosphate phosphoribosyltransferase [Ignavibacteriales bacterium CG_4_9_14_3_um_filter_34_10]
MKKLLFSKIFDIISLLRITQWPKNIFVFVPLVFSKNLFDESQFNKSFLAFIVFSISSSLVYVINDLFDKKRDSNHPTKKHRPIASGRISNLFVITIIGILFLLLLFVQNYVTREFLIIISVYIGINIFYSMGLKQVVILDILFIAAGFMLRVIGGAYVINVSVSSWLILSTLFLSLFLAVIKRKTELLLLTDSSREVLSDYSIEFIKQITAISAAGIIICYSLYTVSDRTINEFGTENLVFTTIFVVFGVFRYMFISEKKFLGENIIEAIYRDYPSIINIMLYLITIYFIIY